MRRLCCVLRQLQIIASHAALVPLEAVRYNQAFGYFDAAYTRPPALSQLQAQVVAAVNPLRRGIRPGEAEFLPTASGLKRQNIEQFGYRGVGELFRPHLTLTRFTDQRPIATDGLPPIADFSGTFNRLALYETGEHGTCIRELGAFPLSGEPR